jgi:hypothetical protein
MVEFTSVYLGFLVKELNPRRRVYVEKPKPARVELKCSHAEGFAWGK